MKRFRWCFSSVILIFFLYNTSPLIVAHASSDATGQETPERSPQQLLDKKTNWAFYTGVHLRTSFNTLANTVDLNKSNDNDKTSYIGYAYDFTVDIRHLSGAELYSFIERRGRADYDCPLAGTRSIHSLFGRYHWYHYEDMTPRLRETWLEIPLTSTKEINLKGGLYPYGREVGNKIALGGKYENYGLSLSGKNEICDWNLHCEKEDLCNKIQLGKIPEFDEAVNRDNDTTAVFSAADAIFKFGKQKLQLYCGWLRDWTPENARSSKFNTSVKKENLFTPGAHLNLNLDRLTVGLEGAKNYGEARSIGPPNYSVEHKGYLLIGDASYNLGAFKPKCKGFIASGNKLNEENYNATTFSFEENRAFSVFSPLNTNLTDTHYQKQFGPYVAMAGGYAVNFGIARPGTFGDPFLFENLVAGTLGFDYTPVDKVYIGMDYWYLRSKENGYGLDENQNVKKFPNELGQELDIFASYQLTKAIKLSLLGGYFFPGDYYKEKRTDTAANNIFSPTPRRDGSADGAYQLELGIDITF